MIEVSLVGFGIATGLLLSVRGTLRKLRAEVKGMPERIKNLSVISLDHLIGKNIYEYLPQKMSDFNNRYLLVMSASCPSCYEKMENLRDVLNQNERDRVLCMLIDDGKRTQRFLNLFKGFYSFMMVTESLMDEMKILIVPCYLEIGKDGIIHDASSDIAKLIGYLKGGEKNV